MPLMIQQYILRLNISIDNKLLVQVLHTETYFREVEPRHILLHFLDLPKVKKKLPTTTVVCYKY